MKKCLILLLVLSLLWTMASCRAVWQEKSAQNILGSSESAQAENITSFEDFTEKLDEEYEVLETQGTEGTVGAELVVPTDKEIDAAPVVTKPVAPTVDTVVKPVQPEPAGPEPTESETTETEEEPEKASETEEGPESTTESEKVTYSYTTGQIHTEISYTGRYLYSILNAQQKEWYRKIDAAVNDLADEVYLDANMETNKNYYIYYLYMMDNPEHFYLINTVGIYTEGTGKGGLILGYSDGVYCSGYDYGDVSQTLKDSIRAKQAIFNAEVNRIISTIPSGAPDVVKELLIYDRIVIDSYYNTSAQWDEQANDNWSAYGVIINKYGVCESYTEAFQLLCLKVGINCTGIVGTAGGDDHKWNAVQLDGQWYACDITFDDPIGGVAGETSHDFFNLTTVQMEQSDHSTAGSDQPGPQCTGTKYSYTNYFG